MHRPCCEADGAFDDSAGEFVVWVFGWPISRLEIGRKRRARYIPTEGRRRCSGDPQLRVAAGVATTADVAGAENTPVSGLRYQSCDKFTPENRIG